jgi:hypothetical protein
MLAIKSLSVFNIFWGPLRAPGRPGEVAPAVHNAVVVSQELLLVAKVLMLVTGT